jgi:5-amino-6-(5-phospho-D-ribitylamino)uracil phosphatase
VPSRAGASRGERARGAYTRTVPRRYDMLAVDLDGTLVDPRGEVSAASAAAIRAAREAGMRVAVCTGRGLAECRHYLEAVGQVEPVAVAGGSIIACPVERRTIHRFGLEPALVEKAVSRLLSHRHPVMVLKDPVHAGYDYLMVVGEQRLALDPVTVWWLERMNIPHRFAATLAEDEHPEHTVRLGVCGLSGALAEITADLMEAFGDHATMHHFPAVIGPEHAARIPEGQRLHILEVFDKDASKWSAVRWLAAAAGIADERICAIGDEINDLPMIRGAGLGIAMGNAVESVKAAAGRQTRSNDEDGVAYAVGRVLEGEW